MRFDGKSKELARIVHRAREKVRQELLELELDRRSARNIMNRKRKARLGSFSSRGFAFSSTSLLCLALPRLPWPCFHFCLACIPCLHTDDDCCLSI